MPKQKLIRLTSDSQDGVFSSTFNEDILIKKDSDIALQSLSVERKSDKIVISRAIRLLYQMTTAILNTV
jgi:hypothetical protein